MTGKMPRWQVIIAILVAAGVGQYVVGVSIGTINERNRRRDLYDFTVQVYFSNINDHTQAVAAYELCLDGVTRSDQNRAQWEQLANIIAALDRGTGGAVNFAPTMRDGPLLSSVPRTEEDCPTPGPMPTPPTLP